VALNYSNVDKKGLEDHDEFLKYKITQRFLLKSFHEKLLMSHKIYDKYLSCRITQGLIPYYIDNFYNLYIIYIYIMTIFRILKRRLLKSYLYSVSKYVPKEHIKYNTALLYSDEGTFLHHIYAYYFSHDAKNRINSWQLRQHVKAHSKHGSVTAHLGIGIATPTLCKSLRGTRISGLDPI